MTLPAAISIAAAALGAAVAFLSWLLSRAPGWQEMRYFALVSISAAIYCFSESFTTIGAPELVIVWASRIGMFAGAFHGPAWVLYIASQQRRSPKLWERALLAAGVLVAIIAAIPNGIVTDRVTYRQVAWLGVTYADVEATTFGALRERQSKDGSIRRCDSTGVLSTTG